MRACTTRMVDNMGTTDTMDITEAGFPDIMEAVISGGGIMGEGSLVAVVMGEEVEEEEMAEVVGEVALDRRTEAQRL